MSLPYIESMEAAAKMANNADLLMAMQKSDSEKLTAPESGMGSLDGDLKVSLCFGVLRCLFVLGCKTTGRNQTRKNDAPQGCQDMIV